jgi:thiamine-phosphate pyrophosphorylase
VSTPGVTAAATRLPARLPPGLYAICDDVVRPDLTVLEKAQRLLEGGALVLQLRMKRSRPADAMAAARHVALLCHRMGALCLINDRVDYALLSRCDGVHLGDDDLPVAEARTLLGPERLIGATVRSEEMIRAAWQDGANYAGLGPIFPSSTKRVASSPIGVARLKEIASSSPLPVVAISGINLSNIGQVAAAGAHGAAVLSDLLQAEDIASRARALVEAFARGHR